MDRKDGGAGKVSKPGGGGGVGNKPTPGGAGGAGEQERGGAGVAVLTKPPDVDKVRAVRVHPQPASARRLRACAGAASLCKDPAPSDLPSGTCSDERGLAPHPAGQGPARLKILREARGIGCLFQDSLSVPCCHICCVFRILLRQCLNGSSRESVWGCCDPWNGVLQDTCVPCIFDRIRLHKNAQREDVCGRVKMYVVCCCSTARLNYQNRALMHYWEAT